jgi:hypothetical protein
LYHDNEQVSNYTPRPFLSIEQRSATNHKIPVQNTDSSMVLSTIVQSINTK